MPKGAQLRSFLHDFLFNSYALHAALADVDPIQL